MRTLRWTRVLAALVAASLALVPMLGCGDKEAEDRAKKMENSIDAQRAGMSQQQGGGKEAGPGPGN
ncbi:MAG: hypothetical protein KIS66_08555 [Fimbriimonadaceae bacterium]|nr:hypothetical protein [Fimbriimonadaceae bacterium]